MCSSRVDREGNRIRVFATANCDGIDADGARNVRSRDCRYQAVAADETRGPEGTIATDHQFAAEVTAVDAQQKAIGSGGCAVG